MEQGGREGMGEVGGREEEKGEGGRKRPHYRQTTFPVPTPFFLSYNVKRKTFS